MPLMKPVAGSDAPRPLKIEADEFRYAPTPRRDERAAPDVGIFDEPTRCLKINLQWWSHISGMIDVLSASDMWAGDDEEKTRAIREIAALLAYNECGDEMTAEEFKMALYEVFNMVARQIVSGRYTNITVDDEGNVSDPSEEGEDAGLPEDDPETTTINEEFAAKTGGVRQAVYGLQEILDDMFNWYSSFTPPSTGVTEAMAAARLVNLYQFDSVKADDFAFYWYNTYQNSSLQVTLDITNGLDALFFCRGMTAQTFAYYIYNVHATAAEVPVLESFLACLNWQQVEDWYTQGISVPSQQYFEYACVPIENETMTLDMSSAENPQKTSVQNLKQQHRYKFTTSGQFTDSDNPTLIGDFYYMHDTSTGVKTYRSGNPFNSTGMNQPSSSQVPWRSDGIYTVILDKTGGANPVIVSRDNAPMNLPNTTGVLTIIMEDLGEYGL